MTIVEAIAISKDYRLDHHSFPADKIGKAMKLGEEAMKRELEHRELDIDTRFGPLPGETAD